MTHLLISIEDIKAKLKHIKIALKITEDKLSKIEYSEDINDFDTIEEYEKDIELFEGSISTYNDILENSKQISLDEKDTMDVLKISLDAVAEAMVTMDKMKQPMDKTEKLFWTAGHTVGYKQALNDLL